MSLGNDVSTQRNESNTNFLTDALCFHSRMGQVLCGKTVENLFKGISDKPPLHDFLRIINIEMAGCQRETITFHFVKCTIYSSASL